MNAGARARRAKDPESQKKKDRATYQRRREKELERGRIRRKDEHYINRVSEWRIRAGLVILRSPPAKSRKEKA